MLLEIRNLSVHYAKVEAVRNVSLSLPEGGIITLIGANGAGKSSILKAISGLVKPSSGEVFYQGQKLTGTPAHQVVAKGIVNVPEGRRLFKLMSVKENLRLGAYLDADRGRISKGIEEVFERFPILREKQNQASGKLSGGQQQMVAIGRALMARPKILLMDEPSLGLSPVMIDEIAALITELRKSGIAIVLVEQNASLALRLSDYAYVLETGSISLEGRSEALLDDPEVARAYLGA